MNETQIHPVTHNHKEPTMTTPIPTPVPAGTDDTQPTETTPTPATPSEPDHQPTDTPPPSNEPNYADQSFMEDEDNRQPVRDRLAEAGVVHRVLVIGAAAILVVALIARRLRTAVST